MTKEEYKNGNKVINAEIEALYVKFDANPNKKTAKLISLKKQEGIKIKDDFYRSPQGQAYQRECDGKLFKAIISATI